MRYFEPIAKHPTLSPKASSQSDQITVADVVRFLLWLPDEEYEQAIELLRAVRDRQRREIWRERLIVDESG